MTYSEAQDRAIESEEESRETIRSYVEQALADGKEPDVRGFLTEYNTPSTRWNWDAVETEVERLLPEETLRKDIRDYVKSGGQDALSFAMLASPKYDRVAGRVIQRMIDEEIVASWPKN